MGNVESRDILHSKQAMNRCSLALLASVVWVTSAIAQVGPPEAEPARRGPGDSRGPRMGRMLERMADELQLDDVQRKELDEIMAAHSTRMEELAPRWAEVREAMRSGDHERAAELRARMGDERGPWDLHRQALDELEPILSDEQHERFMEIREGMQRRWESHREFWRMTRELPDELGMDDAQRHQFRQLLESRRDRMRQRMAEMRPLFERMREGQELGDQDQPEELRRQLEALRPDPKAMRAEFLDQVNGLLREDQRPLLAEYYMELGLISNDRPPEAADVRTVLRAARRLHLRSEQKGRLRTIGRQAMRDLRGIRRAGSLSRLSDAERSALRATGVEGMRPYLDELRRRNTEAMIQLAHATKERIVKMLDEAQAAEYDRQLQQLARRDRED